MRDGKEDKATDSRDLRSLIHSFVPLIDQRPIKARTPSPDRVAEAQSQGTSFKFGVDVDGDVPPPIRTQCEILSLGEGKEKSGTSRL
jgi:hypothetical protein